MAINLAEKYSKKIVDKFYTDSVILGKTSKEYDWDGVKSIKVWTINTVAPGDYGRSSQFSANVLDRESTPNTLQVASMASRYGTTYEVEDTVQTMQITQDKAVSLSVDKGNNTQQMLIKNAGVVMARELREQFVPMFDRYALARWSGQMSTAPSWASNITVKADGTTALDKSTIVSKIFDGVTAIRNAGATIDDAYLYIGETLYAQLLLSTEFINYQNPAFGKQHLENGVMGKIRGVQVVPVPDSYLLKTSGAVVNNANLTEDINFMIVKKSCVLTPTQIKDAKVHQDPPGLSGALLEVRWLYDAFALDTKGKGIYVSLKKAS